MPGSTDQKTINITPPTSPRRSNAPLNTSINFLEIYSEACKEFDITPNRQIIKQLKFGIREFCPSGVLDFSKNFIGDRGLLAVLRLLEQLPHCHTLLLPQNGIRNTGVTALVTVAKIHPSLMHINLSNNPLSLNAALSILDLVRSNQRISQVDLDKTRIDETYILKIAQYLEKNNQNASQLL